MKIIYEEIETPLGGKVVMRSDGAIIPLDYRNTDYQQYLRWLENPDADEVGGIQ